MTKPQLDRARVLLASAAEDASDTEARETLSNLSDQLDRLADSDHGPDHGRLAHIKAKLEDIQARESDAVAVTIEDALDEIHAFRETIEGV